MTRLIQAIRAEGDISEEMYFLVLGGFLEGVNKLFNKNLTHCLNLLDGKCTTSNAESKNTPAASYYPLELHLTPVRMLRTTQFAAQENVKKQKKNRFDRSGFF